MPLKRPCIHPGCPRLTTGTRCDEHEQQRQRERHARRGDQYGAEYQAERRRVLSAASVCYICRKPPTRRDPLTADHIVPAALGGGSAGNLEPAHRSCNSRRGATARGARRSS